MLDAVVRTFRFQSCLVWWFVVKEKKSEAVKFESVKSKSILQLRFTLKGYRGKLSRFITTRTLYREASRTFMYVFRPE